MDETQRNITDSVRALSAIKRDNQHLLAELLGTSQSSVGAKLVGKVRWTVQDLTKLSGHYGVGIEQLTAGPWAWIKAARQTAQGADGVNAGYPGMGSADGIRSDEHYRLDALVAA
jgi:hypothetical protein